jgi:hypothetical protein
MANTHLLLLIAAGCVAVAAGAFWVFARERQLSRRTHEKMERLRREEAAGVPPSAQDYEYAIQFDSDGLAVANLRKLQTAPAAIRWSEIERVVAFKRDLFFVDCLCLLFTSPSGTSLELNEEMARWNSLVETLPQHLPGCLPHHECFCAVAFPAFATNEMEIYSRSKSHVNP